MKTATKYFIRWVLVVFAGPLVLFFAPYVGGLYYMTTGDHPVEQEWLDEAITNLKVLKTKTNDPDLQGVLDYTISLT